jgi:hypothetical protein
MNEPHRMWNCGQVKKSPSPDLPDRPRIPVNGSKTRDHPDRAGGRAGRFSSLTVAGHSRCRELSR